MLFKVLKHPKTQDPQRPMEPEIYVVEEAELLHFLHENAKPGSNSVLVFDVFPEENQHPKLRFRIHSTECTFGHK